MKKEIEIKNKELERLYEDAIEAVRLYLQYIFYCNLISCIHIVTPLDHLVEKPSDEDLSSDQIIELLKSIYKNFGNG